MKCHNCIHCLFLVDARGDTDNEFIYCALRNCIEELNDVCREFEGV